jgi:hypothetical protein
VFDLGSCVVMLPTGSGSVRASLGKALTAERYRRQVESITDPDLRDELRSGVIKAVAKLPSSIRLLLWRELAWPAAGLGRRHGLNLLAADALATALSATAAIATASAKLPPRLLAAAQAEKVPVLTPPEPCASSGVLSAVSPDSWD